MPAILAAAAVAAVLIVTLVLLRRRRNKANAAKRTQVETAAKVAANLVKLNELIDQAASGDVKAMDAVRFDHYNRGKPWVVFGYGLQDEALKQRMQNAVLAGNKAHFLAENTGPMIALRDAWLNAGDAETRIDAAMKLQDRLAYYEQLKEFPGTTTGKDLMEEAIGFTHTQVIAGLDMALNERLSELIAEAEADNLEAFLAAEDLVNSTWHSSDNQTEWNRKFHNVKVAGLVKPPVWNQLLIRYYERPMFDQFATGNLTRQDFVFLSAEAVANGDLVTALLVIAACMVNDWIRTQIGDIRHTQLMDFIVQTRAAQPSATS